MPEAIQAGSGFWVDGMNSYLLPSALSDRAFVASMNCARRGGIVQTRPGTRSLAQIVSDAVRVQGFTAFTPTGGLPHLVAAVDGHIYVSALPFATARRLPTLQFNPTSRFVAFEPCLKSTEFDNEGELYFLDRPYSVLMIQDGATRAAFWNGSTARHLNPTPSGRFDANGDILTVPGFDETFIGLFMKWSGNRLWVSFRGQVFASDFGNPLKFTEAQYINEGRSFYITDECTGMIETPLQDGLIVFTADNGTLFQTSIQDRTLWLTTKDFQKVIFPDIGCVAPFSPVRQYGLIWWFSAQGLINSDAALSLNRTSRMDYQDEQMMCSKGNLGPDLGGVCTAAFENYLLVSVPSGDVKNRHTWCLDQADGANAWDSYWTGWHPVQWATARMNGHERVFFISKDSSNCVRIWEANQPDRTDNGAPITCFAQFKSHAFGDIAANKRFTFAEVFAQEILGDVSLMIAVGALRGSYYRAATKEIAATEGAVYADSIYDITTCMYGNRPQTRTILTQEDPSPGYCNTCGIESSLPNNVDREFSLLAVWSGRMGITGYNINAVPDSTARSGACEVNETGYRSLSEQGCSAPSKYVTGCSFEEFNGSAVVDIMCPITKQNIVAIGSATSVISEADAIRKATWLAQIRADQQCECSEFTYVNTVQRYTAFCEDVAGESKTVIIPAGRYSSTVSQTAADLLAYNAAKAQAESELECPITCYALDPLPDTPAFDDLSNIESYSGSDQYGLLGVEDIAEEVIPYVSELHNWKICEFCDFCDGPETEGQTQENRYSTRWDVTCQNGECLYGISGESPGSLPADLLALLNESAIFTISIGFDGNALPAFAVQEAAGAIKLVRSVAGTPTLYEFPGDFPRLFYDGIVQRDSASIDLICFYVLDGSVKMRFQRDNFGIEYDFVTTSPEVVRITKTDRVQAYQYLYFIDSSGSYRLARSEVYPPFPIVVVDPATNAAAPSGGEYAPVVVNGGAYSEPATNSVAPSGGSYDSSVVDGGAYVEPATNSASPSGGEYALVVVDGGTYLESSTNSVTPQGGGYDAISVNGGTYTENTTNSVAPSGGEYV